MDLCAGGRAVPVFDGQKWADRYRVGGPEAMIDRSSRPHRYEHPDPEIWSISTSRSADACPTAAGTAS
jgi:hypothetical protein